MSDRHAAGNDTLHGDEGDDLIYGGEGDDFLLGGADNDLLVGENGADRINGDAGDDLAFGDDGDDILTGGDGADRIFGNDGEDFISGGLGNDSLFGGGDNDELQGGEGDDLLYGGEDDDQVYGEEGNDTLVGNDGDDLLSGGDGEDIGFGDLGDDQIWGGEGIDKLYGQFGNDVIYGHSGDDLILGGEGHDTIYGGFGDDLIFGSAGNDNLYGQVGADVLVGQAGNDGSFGGVGGGDTIVDREGKNRFLDFGNDVIADVTNADARLVFRHGNSYWTNREIETVDRGFQLLHERTQSTRVLKGTVTSEPMVFVKDSTLSVSDRLATNELVPIQSQAFNPVTNAFEIVTTYERTLTFGDWDEQNQTVNDSYTAQTPGMIAYNWASTEAISAVIPSQSSYWNSFLQISGWTQTRPGAINFFDISQDNAWWFLQSSKFVDGSSTENPAADFSTMWDLYFEDGLDPLVQAEQARLVSKMDKVDQLFSVLTFF